MKVLPLKIVTTILLSIAVFLIGIELFLAYKVPNITADINGTLRNIMYARYYLKSFVFFASIVLAFGFILFSHMIIKPESIEKAKAYGAIAISFLFFSVYSTSLIDEFLWYPLFTPNPLLLESAYLFAITLLVVAMFYKTKQIDYLKIAFFQLGIITTYIILRIVWFEDKIIVVFVELMMVVVAFLGMYYIHSSKENATIDPIDIRSYKRIFMIIGIGKIIELISVIFVDIPQSLLDMLLKGVPLIVALSMMFERVFDEMLVIRLRHEKERGALETKNINIYEYVSEGVFSVSNNYLVNDTYTKACYSIFGTDISNLPMSELIYDEDTSSELVDRILENIFTGKMLWEVGSELLPQQIIVDDRYFQVQYQKMLYQGQDRINEIIVKLHDISDTILLESQLIFERDKLALSMTSMMNREELLTLVSEFMEYMNSINIKDIDVEEVLTIIHTFKGNFGVFNFIHIVSSLHRFESKVINNSRISQDDIEEVLRDLYTDLEIITEVTGSSFFEDKVYLQANINNLESVYNEVKKYFYDTEASLIIYIIQKIFNKSVRDILLFYGRESRKKAMESGKKIKTIQVTGDDVFIDYNHYKFVLRALVHVFNNCIDHGIEEEEERMLIGKPRYGEIQCQVHDYGNFFEISIKDDGRGIDTVKVRDRLLNAKNTSKDEVESMTEDELIDHIFDQEVSTMEDISVTSGRGVGLASVKVEVEKMGGEIRVISFMDFGTEVKVMLPKESEALISYFSFPLLMDLYVEAFKIYFKSNNIITLPVNIVGLESIDYIYEYSVRIPFKGPEEGDFIMSCNRETVWQMAKYFAEDKYLTEETFEEIKYEVLKESCNIIAGNSTSIFDLNQKYIDIDSPELIKFDAFDVKEILYKWHMHYEDYDVILGLIVE